MSFSIVILILYPVIFSQSTHNVGVWTAVCVIFYELFLQQTLIMLNCG